MLLPAPLFPAEVLASPADRPGALPFAVKSGKGKTGIYAFWNKIEGGLDTLVLVPEVQPFPATTSRPRCPMLRLVYV
jgi:hypothetical protein